MDKKKLIFYIVLIIVILVLVFLSQQAYSRAVIKNIVSRATNQASAYLAKGSNWAMSTIYPKITGEVQKRGDAIKTEVNNEKNKVSENISTKIGNYFSGIANSILHPGQNNNCSTQPTQTSPAK